MTTLVNFATGNFKKQQWWNTKTAKWFGGINKVISYDQLNIDADFKEKNKELFKYSKGFGNYFWKPYLIKKALEQVNNQEFLVYADSGTVFIKKIQPLIDYMIEKEQDILCFKLPLIEKQWTKRDAFILLDCDQPEYTETRQITGNFILFRKSKKSEEFVNDYLKYCSDYRIISDAPNTMNKPNYPEFIAHRHDQSVLSLLCKKKNVLVEGDLSDYGYFPYKYIHRDTFIYDHAALDNSKNIFKGTILANRKVHPVKYAAKYFVRIVLYQFGIKT